MYLPQNDSNSDCGAATIALNRTSLVSNLTTTNQVDIDVNNNDYLQYSDTPRQHNHSATEIRDTKITATQDQLKSHFCICQHSPSTPTTQIKPLPSGK